MKSTSLKTILKTIFIALGIGLLVHQLMAEEKNYYLQSLGVVCLMGGLYMVNATLSSRSEGSTDETQE
ncbi:hypothetical protein ACJRPK_12010 [Aquimarina sp. 2-A2]|uniref:hypothetical protein n=1 Tax=Aquimarina sp. 2-A2 TaxID=3382644 RepID=UPI00387F2BDE